MCVCVRACVFALEAMRAFLYVDGREPVHHEKLKIQEHG